MIGKAISVVLLSILVPCALFDHYTGERSVAVFADGMFRRIVAGARISAFVAAGSAGAAAHVHCEKVPMDKATSIHNFTVKTRKGEDYDLAELKGKAVLLMNVASQCGFTNSGYTAATTLYDKYSAQGFTVLGFPCNQFGGQEPGTDEQIAEFACTRFKAAFPLMKKVDVNGDHASPLWDFMKKEKPGLLGTKGIKWNFTSFLCDHEGKVVQRYSPGTGAASIEKDLIPIIKKIADAGLTPAAASEGKKEEVKEEEKAKEDVKGKEEEKGEEKKVDTDEKEVDQKAKEEKEVAPATE